MSPNASARSKAAATSAIEPSEVARASAAEVAACVDLGCAFGLIPAGRAASLKSELAEVSRMLWGLMR